MYTHRPWLDEQADKEKASDRQTNGLVAIVVTLLLLIVGLFLVHQLRNATAVEDCLLSGRGNCDPIVTQDH